MSSITTTAVANLILPHLRDRPLSLKRYPNGIDDEFFFQKDAEDKVPDWVRLEPIFSEHNQDKIHYIICNDRATLIYLANLACIDQNPWMSRIGSLDNPDFALIDLDPTEGCPYEPDRRSRAAGQENARSHRPGRLSENHRRRRNAHLHPARARLYLRASPLLRRTAFHPGDQSEARDLFTTPRTVSQRKKAKVYFDYLQISSAKTIAAPYVLRALSWRSGLHAAGLVRSEEPAWSLAQFNIHNAMDRFERIGDLFEAVLTKPQRLEPALEK